MFWVPMEPSLGLQIASNIRKRWGWEVDVLARETLAVVVPKYLLKLFRIRE